MSKPLSLDDFRARRWILEEDDYAIGGEEIPPTDLIIPEIWSGLVTLPDDIAIRISSHHGRLLAKLYELWADWIEAVGDPDEQDTLFSPMADAGDCFRSSAFDFLHGFYRSSISNLRTALELVAIGALGNVTPKNEAYVRWNKSGGEIPLSTCSRYLRRTPIGRSADFIRGNGIVEVLYRNLCDFAHSKPGASDGAMWKSNGPVYNANAIRLTSNLQFDTFAACYLLVKLGQPNFSVSDRSRVVFDDQKFAPSYKQFFG